jgi:hypothetical protein
VSRRTQAERSARRTAQIHFNRGGVAACPTSFEHDDATDAEKSEARAEDIYRRRIAEARSDGSDDRLIADLERALALVES